MSFPLIIAPLHVGSGPYLIHAHASLGLLKSTTQIADPAWFSLTLPQFRTTSSFPVPMDTIHRQMVGFSRVSVRIRVRFSSLMGIFRRPVVPEENLDR